MENDEHSYLLQNDECRGKPPRDKGGFVYAVFYFTGLTVLFPYSMMITMTDFWKYKFRNTSVPESTGSWHSELNSFQKTFPGYITITGNVPMMIVVLFCSFVGFKFNIKTRLLYSAVLMTIIFSINTALAGLDSDGWQRTLFTLILFFNTVFTVVSAIFQGSFMGNLGRFPPRYIGCCYDGMGLGAVLPVVINIIVVLSDHNIQSVGVSCMSLSLLVMVVVVLLYIPASRTQFYIYFSGLRDNSSPGAAPSLGIAESRFVLQRAWIYVSVVFLTYATNLTVHPAVTALVKPVSKSSSLWNDTLFLPVCCFLCYSVSDWFGKSFATYLQWPGPGRKTEMCTLLISILRIGFLPVLMRCNVAPMNRVTEILFKSDSAYIFTLSVFGILGGFIGNVAMMLGPKTVDRMKQEVVGSIQITAQVFGLGIGSILGPYLVSFL